MTNPLIVTEEEATVQALDLAHRGSSNCRTCWVQLCNGTIIRRLVVGKFNYPEIYEWVLEFEGLLRIHNIPFFYGPIDSIKLPKDGYPWITTPISIDRMFFGGKRCCFCGNFFPLWNDKLICGKCKHE